MLLFFSFPPTTATNTPRSYALAEINRLEAEGHDIQAAVASRTDEPAWAETCMKYLVVQQQHDDGSSLCSLESCFGDRVEISFSDKKEHFRNLHRQTGIPYENMAFFDNEMRNIRSVKTLGVKCIYTPDGMTRKSWKEALSLFGMEDV